MMPVVASLALLLQVAANTDLGYRFPLPDGFGPFPEGRSQRDVVDCWTEVAAASPSWGVGIAIGVVLIRMWRSRQRSRAS